MTMVVVVHSCEINFSRIHSIVVDAVGTAAADDVADVGTLTHTPIRNKSSISLSLALAFARLIILFQRALDIR